MFVLSSTLTVFDRHGNSDEMPLDELFVEDDLSVPRGILRALNIEAAIKEIESTASGFRVLKINLIAHGGYHDVYDVVLDDPKASPLILRISTVDESKRPNGWVQAKMTGEVSLMEFVAKNAPTIPLARVLKSDARGASEGNSVGAPWMLTEKLSGVQLARVYANLTTAEKAAIVEQIASIKTVLFNIRCSSAGRVISLDESGVPTFGPMFHGTDSIGDRHDAPSSVLDFIRSQISLVDQRCPEREVALTRPLLTTLRNAAERVIKDVQSANSFALAHLDLNMSNILISQSPTNNSLVITGIIDWEFHAALPHNLASSYPDWLCYDGYYDPNFHPIGSTCYHSWEESANAAKGLRDVFDAWLRENNQEDYTVGLRNGSFARQMMSWLEHWSNDDAYCRAVLMWLNNTCL